MTDVAVVTLPAVTENVADVEPCGTVTDEGTLAAAALELDSDTATPPLPAGEVSPTIPVPDRPLTIVLGLTDMLARLADGGFTVNPNVASTPRYEAVKVTGVGVVTLPGVTVKVAEFAP